MIRSMLEKERIRLRSLLLMGVLFVVVATFLSCNSSGYRTFTFNKVAHFSFEYPAHYRKFAAHATVEDKTIYIGFRDKIIPEGRTNGFIRVVVEGAGYRYPDAEAALEKTLLPFTEPEKYINPGNLLERSTITVAGVQAELIVYIREADLIPEAPASSLDIMKVTRVVYFDHNNLIWRIRIQSDEDRADQAKADFEHILETFKILD